MTFLKKLGQILLGVAGVAVGVGPLVLPFLGSGQAAKITGVAINDFTAIGKIIVQIEVALEGKVGAEKFAAALPLVGSIIRTSELVSGKKIADPVLFEKAVGEVTQGVVDILQSIHPDEAKQA